MLADARNYVFSGEWWLPVFPGLCISLTVIGFNLLGDALRDVLDPRARGRPGRLSMAPLLEIDDLRIGFPHRSGMAEAVRGVSLCVGAGEAVGLVGESGSGKRLTALAIMRLLARRAASSAARSIPRSGGLVAVGCGVPADARQPISMVFQDPLTSLNPAFTIGRQLVDVIVAHRA